jgi:hypothetical protein
MTIQVKYTDQYVRPDEPAGPHGKTYCFRFRNGIAPGGLQRRSEGVAVAHAGAFLLFPGRIKRDKGVWWMPWQQEAMKDVVHCDKPWGAVNRL